MGVRPNPGCLFTPDGPDYKTVTGGTSPGYAPGVALADLRDWTTVSAAYKVRRQSPAAVIAISKAQGRKRETFYAKFPAF